MRIIKTIFFASITLVTFVGCGDESTEPDAKVANQFDAATVTVDAAPVPIDAAP